MTLPATGLKTGIPIKFARIVVIAATVLILESVPVSLAQPCPPRETLKIEGPPNRGGMFGGAVAFSGDKLLVGSPAREKYTIAKAHIYRFDGEIFVLETELDAGNRKEEDRFGYSVALDGDVAVVGAPGSYYGISAPGDAYVFRYNGADWIEESHLCAPNGAAEDNFGISVDVVSDTILVGASGIDRSGAVFVYRYDGADWVQEAKLVEPDRLRCGFGQSVAMVDNTAMIGAPYWPEDPGDVGAAFVFKRDGTGWQAVQQLAPADLGINDSFGARLGMSGDVVILSAWGDDDYGYNTGAAYVFRNDGTQWVEEAKLYSPAPQEFTNYGSDVAINGSMAVVGSWYDSEVAFRAGAAYTYHFDGANWINGVKLKPLDGTIGDNFGLSAAILDNEIVIGAPGAHAVYYFDMECSCLYLSVENLQGGKQALVEISGGTPGARVVTVYGFKRGQTLVYRYAGYCAYFGIRDVWEDRVIGGFDRTFDANGKTSFWQDIPLAASGKTILLQSAEHGTCPRQCVSNLVEAIVK